jgi:nitrile hydratase
MGGMHGLGPIAPEADEPLFHAPWESRALALTLAAAGWGRWTIDRSRHQRESIFGPDYLAFGYYEKWITALIELMVQEGLVTREEVASGRPTPGAPRLDPPLTAARVPDVLARGGPTERQSARVPQFEVGARVRTRNINPSGHTRLPRYARGHLGEISRRHGAHVFPDANAHGQGEQPQPLYQVRFDAAELWGEGASFRGSVYLDLWEDYLEPA